MKTKHNERTGAGSAAPHGSAMGYVHRLVRRIWCKHEWATHSNNRYAVMRSDGSKEGEVTLTVLDCKKCGASTLIPSDRTHSPNTQVQRAPIKSYEHTTEGQSGASLQRGVRARMCHVEKRGVQGKWRHHTWLPTVAEARIEIQLLRDQGWYGARFTIKTVKRPNK